ncbi:monooxygenase [Flavobacterium rivuli WB 3.3-2 = DSM 21788]|uniref:Monooxygenase n=1 Tax=Flavobacterium rivuli WB 3.3-2 = DSM 21788 TaxID=1121895 RepID=A0A0A2LXR5_9FLAO|nr:NAD(P)/FAD-dependent oxidoreductase [Flavobacterium rivuli]KGO84784.1 monooxygenase [Flavobacterium rivuli WB 3.3-2 = DSM 21788]
MENGTAPWTVCNECKGQGKKSRGLSKKAKLFYQRELEQFEKSGGRGTVPLRPNAHLYTCLSCNGYGIVPSAVYPVADNDKYPHIAIIGGGIGGVALAVACLHRGIPFTLYERDANFNERSQGYGLTLQQAGKAISELGIVSLKDSVISTRHVVHTPEGKVIGEWGFRKWMPNADRVPRRTNMHIARQSLRLALLEQLDGHDTVQWGHQLIDFKECKDGGINLGFRVNGKDKTARADVVVGADGIRSLVRRLLLGNDSTPLRYLGCIVILGICPLHLLENADNPLLDSATVFQTANGNERIYMMPYTSNSVMWQFSFYMPQDEAIALSAQGPEALKAEACRRAGWHDPVPQILAATPNENVSGYPVYDRELPNKQLFCKAGPVTIIGDAAHPMSPFKGQGANQALLDALLLVRAITKGCGPSSQWRTAGIRESVLTEFESKMFERSAVKVKDSAEAARFLHSETVLNEGNAPRGRCLKNKDS